METTNLLHRGARNSGFTMIELLVVLAIIAILAVSLLPALARHRQKSQGIYCLNNGKRMMSALTMYTDDNQNYFPPIPDDGNQVPGHNWCGGQAGARGGDEFNPDILSDPNRCLLAAYLKTSIEVFHCPGDKRMGVYQGSDPRFKGKTVPAARTFSMSQAVGTICPGYESGPVSSNNKPHYGAPTLSVNAPWLNNDRTHHRDAPWRTYGKTTAVVAPQPSGLWVLVDEDVNGLNDAAFSFGMERPFWYDVPGTYHNGGCGFAFADGHSESHTWVSREPKRGDKFHITDPGDRADWLWMRERTSAHISGVNPPPF